MKFYIFFVFLYWINAKINYPTACDCNEHDNQESCEAHKCFWNQNECRISQCNERTLENCIKASQFLSTNPKYCYVRDKNCVELNSCEQLQLEDNPKIAREKCQLYQCAYDLVSGYCFNAEKCDQIYDKETCNSYLIAQSHPLSLESFCYWDNKCQERKSWIQNCQLIDEKVVCEQAGCKYNNNVCQQIECNNLNNNECNGEYVNNQGNIAPSVQLIFTYIIWLFLKDIYSIYTCSSGRILIEEAIHLYVKQLIKIVKKQIYKISIKQYVIN